MRKRALLVGLCPILVSASVGNAAEIDALEVAREMMALGGAGSVRALEDRMAEAGLVEIGPAETGDLPSGETVVALSGLLPGSSGREVVLSCHYGAPTAWAGADGAGCGVALAAASRLAPTPRRHTVRVVLLGSEGHPSEVTGTWLASLGEAGRDRILGWIAIGAIEGGADRDAVVELTLTPAVAGPRTSPAWLTASVLRAARAVERPIGVASARLSLLAQLPARLFLPASPGPADALTAAGVPTVTVSDGGLFAPVSSAGGPPSIWSAPALESWALRLSAAARRLDGLTGRPTDDDQFLAALGRVFSRRDLYWGNLVLWIGLVFAGVPGTWRGRGRSERQRRGRRYLPGFVSRLLYLACFLMLPVFATLLLAPAAAVCAAASRFRIQPRLGIAAACLPWVALLAGGLWAATTGRLGSLAVGVPALLMLAGSLGAMLVFIADRGRAT